MDTYDGLIGEIRAQPGFYLREPRLSHLHMLVYGYWLARLWHNIPDSENDFDFFRFTDWLQAKYQDGAFANKNWSAIIGEKFGDEAGLVRFFELYDEFKAAEHGNRPA